MISTTVAILVIAAMIDKYYEYRIDQRRIKRRKICEYRSKVYVVYWAIRPRLLAVVDELFDITFVNAYAWSAEAHQRSNGPRIGDISPNISEISVVEMAVVQAAHDEIVRLFEEITASTGIKHSGLLSVIYPRLCDDVIKRQRWRMSMPFYSPLESMLGGCPDVHVEAYLAQEQVMHDSGGDWYAALMAYEDTHFRNCAIRRAVRVLGIRAQAIYN